MFLINFKLIGTGIAYQFVEETDEEVFVEQKGKKRKIERKKKNPLTCDFFEYLDRNRLSTLSEKGNTNICNEMNKATSEFELMKSISEKLNTEIDELIKDFV